MNVVLDKEFKNWILGGIIRDASLVSKIQFDTKYVTTSRRTNPVDYLKLKHFKQLTLKENDLIINQKTLQFLLRNNLVPRSSLPHLRCFYTHDTPEHLVKSKLIEDLNAMKRVLVMNKFDYEMLVNLGVTDSKLRTVYGAVDRKKFYPSSNLKRPEFVLVTGDAKGRKNPFKVLEVISENKDLKFIICGRYWKEFVTHTKKELSNLEIVDFSHETNEELMRTASAFMTLSLQEGGPYPVLEALASGTPVVSTQVGWVPEIVNEKNGRIISQDAAPSEVGARLKECILLKGEVHGRDLLNGKYTWVELADKLFIDSDK